MNSYCTRYTRLYGWLFGQKLTESLVAHKQTLWYREPGQKCQKTLQLSTIGPPVLINWSFTLFCRGPINLLETPMTYVTVYIICFLNFVTFSWSVNAGKSGLQSEWQFLREDLEHAKLSLFWQLRQGEEAKIRQCFAIRSISFSHFLKPRLFEDSFLKYMFFTFFRRRSDLLGRHAHFVEKGVSSGL